MSQDHVPAFPCCGGLAFHAESCPERLATVWKPLEQDGCSHAHIIPIPNRDASGIVWGRCLGCDDDTFVISEPGFDGEVDGETHSSLQEAAVHIEKLESELSSLRRMAYEFGWIGTEPTSLEEWLRVRLADLQRRKS
jgi:hypothetical protein